MDHVQPPQQYDPQYGQQYDPRQYGFLSRLGESSHIQDDAAEPAQTGDFTSLALGWEHRDVGPPPRYTPGAVSCLFYNLVNINYKKI
jgi:hypothetical protein